MTEIGKLFLEATSYPYVSQSDQSQEVPPPPLETPLPPGTKLIELPDPKLTETLDLNLAAVVESRRSLREFSSRPLTLDELAYLLWSTAGVKEQKSIATLRTVPSAGARHPFDTWLAVQNVQGLRPGLYRYLALSHQLALMEIDPRIGEKTALGCLNQQWIAGAAVTFIWVAVAYRTSWRYSQRSWRYIFLDAGHVCQNLYLSAENINCGCCAVAAYDDKFLNDLLGLDGLEQFVIYLGPVGPR